MNEVMLISTLGLPRNEHMSLASMMKLTAALREHYRLGEPEDPTADLMFVNADKPAAISTLHSFQQRNKFLTAIMVISREREMTDTVTIRRPLVFKRIMEALKKATELPKRNTSGEKGSVLASAIKKILVVDDSFSVRKYMEHKIPMLSQTHIELNFAASGEEAMMKVKEAMPDLVFLDVMMPGVDGYKVCKWIKSVRHATHVAMLTSKKSPFDKVRGAMSGCDSYLTKPPEEKKLAKILAK
jgi:twitching motility two-component system response regulator PilG